MSFDEPAPERLLLLPHQWASPLERPLVLPHHRCGELLGLGAYRSLRIRLGRPILHRAESEHPLAREHTTHVLCAGRAIVLPGGIRPVPASADRCVRAALCPRWG